MRIFSQVADCKAVRITPAVSTNGNVVKTVEIHTHDGGYHYIACEITAPRALGKRIARINAQRTAK